MIYLLRHGETVWNTTGRFQGQKDSPLTQRGIEQADQVRRLLARKIVGIESQFEVHVSPLGRARQTAERIAQSIQLPSKDDARLMEVTVGSWDGMTHFEIDMEYTGALQGADTFDWYFRSPDGETFDHACDRAKGWLADVYQPTIAISHGLMGRILRGVYMGLSRRAMLELPVPQNGFHRLADKQVDFIELE